MRIVVFFSGTGTNLKSILEHQKKYNYEVCSCFTNNPIAGGIGFCNEYKIDCKIIDHKNFNDREKYDGLINSYLENLNPDLIVLAGYMRIMSKSLVDNWEGQIINIHPSLLPKYGGKGMYGQFVHRKVIENKEIKSGITIHFVNEKYDEGKIIFQKDIEIKEPKTSDSLANQIHKLEMKYFPLIIEKLIS